jgi:hypothetical protein
MNTLKNLQGNEKGATMVESAIAMPLYVMCLFFIPAVIPFMFNMLGAHYASVLSLQEIATGEAPTGVTLEQHLINTLQNNFAVYTTGLDLQNVTVNTIIVDQNGQRVINTVPANNLPNNPGFIPRRGFVSIASEIRFINMSAIGLPDFRSSTLAVKKMEES